LIDGLILKVEEAQSSWSIHPQTNAPNWWTNSWARNEDYAAHWTPFWEDALASATTAQQGGIPTRGNYRDWITTILGEQQSLRCDVAELIDPTMPGTKTGEANANGIVSTVDTSERHAHRHDPECSEHGASLPGHRHEMRKLPQSFSE
jgi:hypothetical protein